MAAITTVGATAEVALAIVAVVGVVLVERVVCRESLLAIATRLRLTSN